MGSDFSLDVSNIHAWGCCGNYVGASHYIHWWLSNTDAWEMRIHYLTLKTITLSCHGADNLFKHDCSGTAVLCIVFHTTLFVAAWILLSCSDALLWLCNSCCRCVVLRLNGISNHVQSMFSFLLSRFPKVTIFHLTQSGHRLAGVNAWHMEIK